MLPDVLVLFVTCPVRVRPDVEVEVSLIPVRELDSVPLSLVAVGRTSPSVEVGIGKVFEEVSYPVLEG